MRNISQDMLDKNLIKDKIRNIQEYLGEIEPILSLKVGTTISNIEKLRTLERDFQLIVDEMLDINIHFIRELNLKSPDDFQSTFVILGENGIIPLDFAQKMAPAVGLRNRIVHRYESLDREFFVRTFRSECLDFNKYIKLINQFLKKR